MPIIKKIFFKKVSAVLALFIVCGFSLTLGAILLRVAFSAFTQPTLPPTNPNQELGQLMQLIGKYTDTGGSDTLFGRLGQPTDVQAVGSVFGKLADVKVGGVAVGTGGNKITATKYTGNLGGYIGADQKCQAELGSNYYLCRTEIDLVNQGDSDQIPSPYAFAVNGCDDSTKQWCSSSSINIARYKSFDGLLDTSSFTCDMTGFLLCCNYSTPPSAPGCYECGDSVVQTGEECDTTKLAGKTCADLLGDGTGTLACYPKGDAKQCQFNLSQCQGCGDLIISTDRDEQCDKTNLNNADCSDFYINGTGTLACYPKDNPKQCQFDISQCQGCGDGIVKAPEQCEKDKLGGKTCLTEGFMKGTLLCNNSCNFHKALCFNYAKVAGFSSSENNMVVGSDNFPILLTEGDLVLQITHCNDNFCQGFKDVNTIDTLPVQTGYVDIHSGLVIGSDNLPIIAYSVLNPGGLSTVKVAHCQDAKCSVLDTKRTLLENAKFFSGISIVIGSDNLPLIVFSTYKNEIERYFNRVIHCSDIKCAAEDASTDYQTVNGTDILPLIIGSDGLPVLTIGSQVSFCLDKKCTNISKIQEYAIDIIIAKDGNPLLLGKEFGVPLVYMLYVKHCGDIRCSQMSRSDSLYVPSGAWSYSRPKIILDKEGIPVIIYNTADGYNDKAVLSYCVDSVCSYVGGQSVTLDTYFTLSTYLSNYATTNANGSIIVAINGENGTVFSVGP